MIRDDVTYLYVVSRIGTAKCYYGITYYPRRRFLTHRSVSKKINSKTDTPFYRALRKYGCDAFTWEVIAEFPTRRLASAAEKFAIACGAGYYNATQGGDGGKHTEETRNKLRLLNIGKTMSLESRKKMSIAKKGRKQTPEHAKKSAISRTGKKQSPEHSAKIRSKTTGKKRTVESLARIEAAQKNRRIREGQEKARTPGIEQNLLKRIKIAADMTGPWSKNSMRLHITPCRVFMPSEIRSRQEDRQAGEFPRISKTRTKARKKAKADQKATRMPDN